MPPISTVSVAPNGTSARSPPVSAAGMVNRATRSPIGAVVLAQQSADQVFTVIVDDGHGGTATQNVTVTLTRPCTAGV
jgi:hypothetical protein